MTNLGQSQQSITLGNLHTYYNIDEETSCWIWNRSTNGKGYGYKWYEGRKQLAHRIVWLLLNPKIPEGLFICHSCDVRACINPEHLFIATNQENMIDASQKGRLGKNGTT